jgi:F-type H+-transporting ATPase subunit epsilon
MAGSLQFDLVSPERRLASFSATEVQIPGAMGDMTAMAGHASTITSLRPGILRVVAADGTKSFVVTGGFAEISAAGVSVLAEQAMPLEELTPSELRTRTAPTRRWLTLPHCGRLPVTDQPGSKAIRPRKFRGRLRLQHQVGARCCRQRGQLRWYSPS